jgi:hypothetical protein
LTISCTNPNTFYIYTDADLATKVNNTWTGCNDILNSTFSNSPQFNSTKAIDNDRGFKGSQL